MVGNPWIVNSQVLNCIIMINETLQSFGVIACKLVLLFLSIVLSSHNFFLPPVPTGPPQQVTAQPSDATTLVIQWQPPLDIHRNGVIRRYIVNITELETLSLLPYITTNLSITVTSLHPFYRYSYIVTTETIGLGPYSDTRIVHMPEAGILLFVQECSNSCR